MEKLKKGIQWVRDKVGLVRKKVNEISMAVSVVFTVGAMTLNSFAADEFTAIQAADLAPILDGAKQNLAVIIPVAIGLFAIVLGVGFIPIIIKKFRH